MELIQNTPDLSAYLATSEAIDHGHPRVRATAAALRAHAADAYTYAKAAFEFVRDTVPHSQDAGDPRVTWRASDVLALRTGICFAKSHALAALLRAEGIPAALCYQKLDTLHGLIALKLPGARTWARQDPRGNRPGVDARFRLDREQLAWPVRPECNEMDSPVLFAEPHPAVLQCLRQAVDRPHLWQTLPTEL
ncbi:transglutaminase-like domain-containing protein [Streptomyces pinistramenti]|uniref:transglutaminase-like domain-containing protein n=1 Tax=Streptomyces pinistramenti TaxID=2884812 RepID=UPI001D07EE52|nr:transglutaminase family protein [Streptomyces pinistramenti]MCB5909173.1 transglutaminase family protein [Streptomyces pinistramenti]